MQPHSSQVSSLLLHNNPLGARFVGKREFHDKLCRESPLTPCIMPRLERLEIFQELVSGWKYRVRSLADNLIVIEPVVLAPA